MRTASQLPPPIPFTVLRGHTDAVNSIEFLEDDAGKLISGSADGEVKVWDLAINRPVASLKAHLFPVLSVHSLPGSKIGSSGRDSVFRVWDLNANGLNPSVSIFTGCEHFCSSATNGGDVIATPDGNSQILLWDIRDVKSAPVMTLKLESDKPSNTSNGERVGMVTSIHMTSYRRTDADGYAVFGGYEDGSIAQYDLRTGNVVRDYKKGLEPVLAMDLKPSMDTLMFGGGDEHMTKLMIEDSKSVYEDSSLAFAETQTVTLAAPGTSSIKYRCDGRIIVSGHWDNTMRIFDQKKLKPLAVIGHHAGGVYSIAFGKGGASTVFASASKDKTIALWDLFSDSLNR